MRISSVSSSEAARAMRMVDQTRPLTSSSFRLPDHVAQNDLGGRPTAMEYT